MMFAVSSSGTSPSPDSSNFAEKPPRIAKLPRFVQFGIVGGVGVVVNFGFYLLLHDLLGVLDLIALAIAIELSIINNFVLNDRWTFRDRTKSGRLNYFKRFFAFHLSSGFVAMVVQLSNQYVQTRLFGVWDKLALIMGIGLGALANYLICDLLIFRQKTERPAVT